MPTKKPNINSLISPNLAKIDKLDDAEIKLHSEYRRGLVDEEKYEHLMGIIRAKRVRAYDLLQKEQIAPKPPKNTTKFTIDATHVTQYKEQVPSVMEKLVILCHNYPRLASTIVLIGGLKLLSVIGG